MAVNLCRTILVFLLSAGPISCGKDSLPGSSPNRRGQSQFELSGSIDSAEIFYGKTVDKAETVCRSRKNGTLDVLALSTETDRTNDSLGKKALRYVRIFDVTLAYRTLSSARLRKDELPPHPLDTDPVVVIKNNREFVLGDNNTCKINYSLSENEKLLVGEIECPRLEENEGSGQISLTGQFSCDRRIFKF